MKQSAGILLYRTINPEPEVFLVHPGGPFFSKKHEGWWTIPKGELLPGEEPLAAAVREFKEETGYMPKGPYAELQHVVQKGGKQVLAWACEGNFDAGTITCNTFVMEWPPKSGTYRAYPEVDKAGWFKMEEAALLINERQKDFLCQLKALLVKM
jgi:predicted NUDIX family NTP pyrophosphohydrolase